MLYIITHIEVLDLFIGSSLPISTHLGAVDLFFDRKQVIKYRLNFDYQLFFLNITPKAITKTTVYLKDYSKPVTYT